MNYAPINFSSIEPEFKDEDAAYMGLLIFSWSSVWNTNHTQATPLEYPDFLKPELKDKLVLTYPNDDDAVLFQFDLMYVALPPVTAGYRIVVLTFLQCETVRRGMA